MNDHPGENPPTYYQSIQYSNETNMVPHQERFQLKVLKGYMLLACNITFFGLIFIIIILNISNINIKNNIINTKCQITNITYQSVILNESYLLGYQNVLTVNITLPRTYNDDNNGAEIKKRYMIDKIVLNKIIRESPKSYEKGFEPVYNGKPLYINQKIDCNFNMYKQITNIGINGIGIPMINFYWILIIIVMAAFYISILIANCKNPNLINHKQFIYMYMIAFFVFYIIIGVVIFHPFIIIRYNTIINRMHDNGYTNGQCLVLQNNLVPVWLNNTEKFLLGFNIKLNMIYCDQYPYSPGSCKNISILDEKIYSLNQANNIINKKYLEYVRCHCKITDDNIETFHLNFFNLDNTIMTFFILQTLMIFVLYTCMYIICALILPIYMYKKI